MRVYEFAKKANITAKKAVSILREGGFPIASHMAFLDDKACRFLERSLASSASPARGGASKKNGDSISASKPKRSREIMKNGSRESVSGATSRTSSRAVEPKKLSLQPMAVDKISEVTGIPLSQLIVQLMRWGQLVGKNQTVSADMVARIAQEYNIPTVDPEVPTVVRGLELEGGSEQRLPVVVVLGHVDHGKTTLLDFIRKTRVTAREKGGITQHLGAYEAKTKHGQLIFLDTPGHAAFTKIRQRGARVADIAILVIAADDSIMPQTIEAIEHIRASKIPLVVAINKIDKVEPGQIDIIKRDLAQHDLLPEEWGGKTVICPISAKKGTSVDDLLELVALQAELLELTTTTQGCARGYVLESSMERGRGAVATVLLRQGTLKVGDYFKAGAVRGRVSSIVDSFGKSKRIIKPSIPVRVAGFERLPEAGDLFIGIEKSEHKKLESAVGRSVRARFIPENAINLIVKTDTKSSREALLDSIAKLSGKMGKKYSREFYVVDSGIGDVVETDVLLAESSGAIIVALHTKASTKAQELAQRSGVTIKCYEIIYKLLDELERAAYEGRKIVTVKEKSGTAEVRKVFDVKGLGVIAGCYVKDGVIVKNGYIKALRNGYPIGEGPIVSLQSEKKTVKEVRAGRECGFIIKEVTEWQEGDIAECYIEVTR